MLIYSFFDFFRKKIYNILFADDCLSCKANKIRVIFFLLKRQIFSSGIHSEKLKC